MQLAKPPGRRDAIASQTASRLVANLPLSFVIPDHGVSKYLPRRGLALSRSDPARRGAKGQLAAGRRLPKVGERIDARRRQGARNHEKIAHRLFRQNRFGHYDEQCPLMDPEARHGGVRSG